LAQFAGSKKGGACFLPLNSLSAGVCFWVNEYSNPPPPTCGIG